MRKVFLIAVTVLGMVMAGCEPADETEFDPKKGGCEVNEEGTITWMTIGGQYYETTLPNPENVKSEVGNQIETSGVSAEIISAALSSEEEVVGERVEGSFIFRKFKSQIDIKLPDFAAPVYFLQEKAFLKTAENKEYPFPSPNPEFSTELENNLLGSEVIDNKVYSRRELILKARIRMGERANPIISSTKVMTRSYANIIIDDSVDVVIDSIVIVL